MIDEEVAKLVSFIISTIVGTVCFYIGYMVGKGK